MTQKHFQALAHAIRYECKNDEERERMAKIIGDVCAEFNSNFKRERFRRACFNHADILESN